MTVEKPGKFNYCFSNEMSSYARKVLSWVSLFLLYKISSTAMSPLSFLYTSLVSALSPHDDGSPRISSLLASGLPDIESPSFLCQAGSYRYVHVLITRFNVHGVLYLGDEEHIAPVEQAIRDLSSGLQLVKDEQAYLVVRERIHRNSMPTSPFLLYNHQRQHTANKY